MNSGTPTAAAPHAAPRAAAPRSRALHRSRRLAAGAFALSALSAGLVSAPGRPLPAQRAWAQQEPTPIIEPQPQPTPIFLPLTLRSYKASAPDPLDNERTGHLTGLSPSGREACRPAPYALLSQPEGRPGSQALAVLYAGPRSPNLDLFVGEAVRVSGVLHASPAGCRLFTPWMMEVERIERIDLPPLR